MSREANHDWSVVFRSAIVETWKFVGAVGAIQAQY